MNTSTNHIKAAEWFASLPEKSDETLCNQEQVLLTYTNKLGCTVDEVPFYIHDEDLLSFIYVTYMSKIELFSKFQHDDQDQNKS